MNPQPLPGSSTAFDLREMERRSQDQIIVNNHSDEPQTVLWNSFVHTVPPHSYAIFPRYLAEKYLTEQTARILNEITKKAIKEEDERRLSKGMARLNRDSLSLELENFEMKYYTDPRMHTEDESTLQEFNSLPSAIPLNQRMQWLIVKLHGLFGGIDREFGLEYIDVNMPKLNPNLSLIEILNKEVPTTSFKKAEVKSSPLAPDITDLMSKDVFTLRKIAKEKGLTPEKTATKEDLIRSITA